ncbi:MAG: transketolase [Acidobacteriota bacterium]|nr:transketolase [Acidobacteriota bacterium]
MPLKYPSSRDAASPVSAERIDALRSIARRVRGNSLRMVHGAKLGHPGGDLSAADILTALYFGVLRLDPANPRWPARDRFILSKGHCSAALYAVLAEAGFIERELLKEYAKPLSLLNGHPDRNKVPGVEANTGPLGHGLPIGVGAAKAAKIAGADWRTFVLTGDGELQEGSNWEAAMAAAHFGLDNLTVIVDRNRLQQGDETERTVALEPLAERWRAFGWTVREIDGHDMEALVDTLAAAPFSEGRPNCVIAHTHKGRGVSFMEDRAEWHHRVPTDGELGRAIAEIDGPSDDRVVHER